MIIFFIKVPKIGNYEPNTPGVAENPGGFSSTSGRFSMGHLRQRESSRHNQQPNTLGLAENPGGFSSNLRAFQHRAPMPKEVFTYLPVLLAAKHSGVSRKPRRFSVQKKKRAAKQLPPSHCMKKKNLL
jgi:hypothetical protein